jgi:hypothetical protein
MFGALKRNRPNLDPAKLDRTRTLMATAVRDWKVTDFEPLIDSRHGLALSSAALFGHLSVRPLAAVARCVCGQQRHKVVEGERWRRPTNHAVAAGAK